jgi:hypothetical protein
MEEEGVAVPGEVVTPEPPKKANKKENTKKE